MVAELLLRERHVLDESAFAELVVWRLPRILPGSAHGFKYRLAYVEYGTSVLRFDNEKGDHKHVGETESPYAFASPERLIADFWAEIDQWRATT